MINSRVARRHSIIQASAAPAGFLLEGNEMPEGLSGMGALLGAAMAATAAAAAVACSASSAASDTRRARSAVLVQAKVRGWLCRLQVKRARRHHAVGLVTKALLHQPREHGQQHQEERQEEEEASAQQQQPTTTLVSSAEKPTVPRGPQRELAQSLAAQRGRGKVEALGGELGAWHQLYESVRARGTNHPSVVAVESSLEPRDTSAAPPSSLDSSNRGGTRDSKDSSTSTASSTFKAYQHQARRRTTVGVQKQLQEKPEQQKKQRQQRQQHQQQQHFHSLPRDLTGVATGKINDDSDPQIDMDKLLAQLNKNRSLLQPRDINSNG